MLKLTQGGLHCTDNAHILNIKYSFTAPGSFFVDLFVRAKAPSENELIFP